MAKSGNLDKRGIEFTDLKLNLEKLMQSKRNAVTALTGGIKVSFCKFYFGISLFKHELRSYTFPFR